MNKNILWVIGLLIFTTISFAACSESSDDVDPYANWDVRNQDSLNAVVKDARRNIGDNPGQWRVIPSYKLKNDMNAKYSANDSVYCKIIQSGSGQSPLFTDSVYVNYRGKLINGTVFDQSYKGDLNSQFDIPVIFSVGGVITGWTTALQQMVPGDVWELYIPSDLAYGTSGTSGIPANSTLVFTVDLVKVVPLKGNGRAVEDLE